MFRVPTQPKPKPCLRPQVSTTHGADYVAHCPSGPPPPSEHIDARSSVCLCGELQQSRGHPVMGTTKTRRSSPPRWEKAAGIPTCFFYIPNPFLSSAFSASNRERAAMTMFRSQKPDNKVQGKSGLFEFLWYASVGRWHKISSGMGAVIECSYLGGRDEDAVASGVPFFPLCKCMFRCRLIL